jgi:protein required for attachment to host cells
MSTIWILSANGGKARIFSAESPTADLVEIATITHPESRLRAKELASDRPGRAFDTAGVGRHAMSSQVDAKEQEQIRFAREIVDRLDQGRVEGDFEHLVVVAAPGFLGHLRATMAGPLQAMVSAELVKDYTELSARELREQLPSTRI